MAKVDVETVDPLTLPSLPLESRKELPETPCIYFAIASDGIQYIGRSVNLRQRWGQHHRQSQLEEMEGVRVAWLEVSDRELLPALPQSLSDESGSTEGNGGTNQ